MSIRLKSHPSSLLALMAGTLAVGTASLPPLGAVQRVDRALYDTWSRLAAPPFPEEIVVVDLEDSDWLATLAALASDHGARLTVSTLDTPTRELSDHGVLGPTAIAVGSSEFLRETGWARGGVLWARPDFDGVVRHDQPILYREAPVPSLALAGSIALRQSGSANVQQHEIIAYGQPLETDSRGRRWLRYFDRSTMRRLAPEAIVADPGVLRGKIVIAGIAAERHTTPVGLLTAQELMAHAIAGYWLDNSILTSVRSSFLAWGFGAVLLLCIALLPIGPLWCALVPIAGAAALLLAAAGTFIVDGLWLPNGGPILIALLGGAIALWLRYVRPLGVAAASDEAAAEAPTPAEALLNITHETPAGIRTLGRYELLIAIGHGTTGNVYVARDLALNRKVAIKTLDITDEREMADVEELKARFINEAELIGRLNHPNIVTIYDAGEYEHVMYIATELLHGKPLSHFTDPRRLLPVCTTLEIVATIALTLDYAHDHNVVHGDIKPANILYDSTTKTVKLTDFGKARLMDVSRTRTGRVLGTPSFMSPEQPEGEKVNGHTDLFALGVSLYQLLTGRLPFAGSSMSEFTFASANEPYTPISSVRPELPSGIDAIVDKVLAKNVGERFESGAHMADALLEHSGKAR